MQSDAARDILLEAVTGANAIQNHKTRRAVVAALGEYRDPRVAAALIAIAKSDPSYAVESEACKSLAGQDATDEVITVLIANSQKQSWRDQVRTAAVEALGTLGDTRGIEPSMMLASYGQPFRSRSTGFEALGKLGRDNEKSRAQIRRFLLDHIDDPQERSARAAIAALGEIGDEKAIPDLEKLSNSGAPKDLRDRARESIDKIRKGGGESATVRGLRERIEALEKDREQRTRTEEDKAAPATAPGR